MRQTEPDDPSIYAGHSDAAALKWQQSSHQHVAVCNDCHLPHDAVGKWVTKADNGFFHSLAFTTDEQLAPIRKLQRKAMWRLDYIVSENSKGFRAGQTSARVLAESMDYSRQAIALCYKLSPK
jgi:formate-dependent nitrite reductase cytochrome c552 subunit